MRLLVVGGEDVQRALSMQACIEAVDRAMRSLSEERALVPLRTIMRLPDGPRFFGVMPGFVQEPGGLGAKILTVYPDNPRQGLPSHVGLVVLFDSERGVPLAVMDAARVTAIRTAAASAVATRALARSDARRLAILGTGEQAVTHLEAICRVRTLESIQVWGRAREKAEKLAAEQSAGLGFRIQVAASAEHAVRDSDIVCTVTSSREPILCGAWIAPGSHVNLVGSSQLFAREADDDVVAMSRFFVDSRTSARAEAGELKHAMDAGLIAESHVLGEIGDVLGGAVHGRTSEQDVTVYKSLGVAVQDLAAAHVIYEQALREGLGTLVPF